MAITPPTQNQPDDMEVVAGQTNSFKDIAMSQLRALVTLSNVEFRGGFYSIITTKDGSEREIYVPDSREVFSNGVYMLAMLVQPKFNKDMEIAFEKFKEDLEKIEKDFIDASSPNEEVILGDSFYENADDKILLETFKEKKLLLYIELFTQLATLFSKKNYWEVGGMTF